MTVKDCKSFELNILGIKIKHTHPIEKAEQEVQYIYPKSTLAQNNNMTNFLVLEDCGGNTGNNVFTNALEKYFTSENNYPFVISGFNEINAKKIILACANLINPKFNNYIDYLYKQIKNIDIPIYMIGLGTQSDLEYSFDFLKDMTPNTKKLLKKVYNSGGAIGVRGYFTGQVLEKLGFKEYNVTGCPSLYQNGRDFQVNYNKVERENFKAALNGHAKEDLYTNENYYKNNQNIYICQDEFLNLIRYGKDEEKSLPEHVHKMLLEGRIKLFTDIYEWKKEIKKYNFVYGSRFHGAVVAITNNVPAMILNRDSRTRELCEFFKIPHINKELDTKDLYKLYLETDYTDFNNNYKQAFDNFKDFITKNEIPNFIGEENKFFKYLEENKNNLNLYKYFNKKADKI